MDYPFLTVDVFTDQLFGGNPLALFPDAGGLDSATMQQIAREFNLSETVFVFPPDDPAHTSRLRIFTPGMELPFAGHPTIGAALMLADRGAIPLQGEETRIVFEEGAGPVRVAIRARDGRPITAQLTAARLPELGPPPPDRAHLAALLGLDPDEILDGSLRPEALSCGVPFLFVPVRDLAALARARVDGERWARALAPFWAPHLYLFTPTPDMDHDLRARMFAPAMGIPEDPATGAAATALAAYLAMRDERQEGVLRWTVVQGVEMGRPSRLEIEAEKEAGTIVATRVGGTALLVSEGTLYLPDTP